jgi:hypothetical protein
MIIRRAAAGTPYHFSEFLPRGRVCSPQSASAEMKIFRQVEREIAGLTRKVKRLWKWISKPVWCIQKSVKSAVKVLTNHPCNFGVRA